MAARYRPDLAAPSPPFTPAAVCAAMSWSTSLNGWSALRPDPSGLCGQRITVQSSHGSLLPAGLLPKVFVSTRRRLVGVDVFVVTLVGSVPDRRRTNGQGVAPPSAPTFGRPGEARLHFVHRWPPVPPRRNARHARITGGRLPSRRRGWHGSPQPLSDRDDLDAARPCRGCPPGNARPAAPQLVDHRLARPPQGARRLGADRRRTRGDSPDHAARATQAAAVAARGCR